MAYRDGGTIVLTGIVNRSVSARVRLDGRMTSETRGQVFVAGKFFLDREFGPEQPISLEQRRDLRNALDQYLTTAAAADLTDIEQAVYGRLINALIAGPQQPIRP